MHEQIVHSVFLFLFSSFSFIKMILSIIKLFLRCPYMNYTGTVISFLNADFNIRLNGSNQKKQSFFRKLDHVMLTKYFKTSVLIENLCFWKSISYGEEMKENTGNSTKFLIFIVYLSTVNCPLI